MKYSQAHSQIHSEEMERGENQLARSSLWTQLSQVSSVNECIARSDVSLILKDKIVCHLGLVVLRRFAKTVVSTINRHFPMFYNAVTGT